MSLNIDDVEFLLYVYKKKKGKLIDIKQKFGYSKISMFNEKGYIRIYEDENNHLTYKLTAKAEPLLDKVFKERLKQQRLYKMKTVVTSFILFFMGVYMLNN